MPKIRLYEEWRPVPRYEGIYEVSNRGNIRTVFGRPMKTHCSTGYRRLNLYKDGIKSNYPVHRIVALAFIPNPEDKPIINHKDYNRSNNAVSNLEWCTLRENAIHAADPLSGRDNNPYTKLYRGFSSPYQSKDYTTLYLNGKGYRVKLRGRNLYPKSLLKLLPPRSSVIEIPDYPDWKHLDNRNKIYWELKKFIAKPAEPILELLKKYVRPSRYENITKKEIYSFFNGYGNLNGKEIYQCAMDIIAEAKAQPTYLNASFSA